jgi:hypothetical protein
VSRAVSRAFHAGTRVLDCQGTDAWTAPSSKQEVQRLRALVVPFRERANVELLFANRDRSAAELGRALRFLEGEAAGRFQEQLSVALDDVIDATLADLGERLETAAEARCPL